MNRYVENVLLSLKESLIMALSAIRTNKLRSMLTLLGIAVGVFSIIGVMTAMGALISSIESGMSQLGTNTFQVQKYPVMGGGNQRERARFRNRKDITYLQGLRVKEKTTLAKAVGLEVWQFGRIVKTPTGIKTNPNVQVAGEDVEGVATNNWIVEDGRMFTQEEFNSSKSVALIGKAVKDKLFPREFPIGKTVIVDNKSYQIIGTITSKGEMLGSNNDNFIIVPLSQFLEVYGQVRSVHIMVQATSTETFDDCIEQVRGILRTARQVEPGSEDDFEFFSNESLINTFNDMTKYVRLGIMLISAIALIAAGVGIMNIMLVSVTERTREIGIRKAVGAKKANILYQFILEAVLLSEIGGIIGIVIGVISGNLIALLLSVPPVIPVNWVIVGFVTCSVVGIIFGVYPAWKAANLDPIESLRYE